MCPLIIYRDTPPLLAEIPFFYYYLHSQTTFPKLLTDAYHLLVRSYILTKKKIKPILLLNHNLAVLFVMIVNVNRFRVNTLIKV